MDDTTHAAGSFGVCAADAIADLLFLVSVEGVASARASHANACSKRITLANTDAE